MSGPRSSDMFTMVAFFSLFIWLNAFSEILLNGDFCFFVTLIPTTCILVGYYNAANYDATTDFCYLCRQAPHEVTCLSGKCSSCGTDHDNRW